MRKGRISLFVRVFQSNQFRVLSWHQVLLFPCFVWAYSSPEVIMGMPAEVRRAMRKFFICFERSFRMLGF